MSRAIVDISVFVARETGPPLGDLPDEIAVSVITAAELELGVPRAADPSPRAARLSTLLRVRAACPLLPIDEPTASCFARLADEQLRAVRKPRRHDSLDRGDRPSPRRRRPDPAPGFSAFSSVQVVRV